MKPAIFRAILAAAAVFAPMIAQGNVITRCGESDGWAYFFEGGLVGPGQGGWKEDAISGGAIEVHLVDEKLDLVFFDATGGPYSHTLEGAEVYLSSIRDTPSGGRTFTVIADNRGSGLLET